MADLLAYEEALRLVLERARPLPAERVAVADAAGRVLAEDARAAVDLPPFASSAMDGFALQAADAPARLPVVDRIAAGRPAARALRRGEAMAIATGGVVPDGADAVVPIESVVVGDNTIEVRAGVVAGANIRPRGGDVGAGAVVVAAGTRAGAAHVGALAAAGVAGVRCARRPRVAVLTTGTELQPPGAPLALGQVYEANGAMIAAQVVMAGAEAERLAPVADDHEAHRAAIARGLEHDVLVTSGGVSVGPHDLVRAVEAELGAEEVFWRVAVKPGKPVSFAVRVARSTRAPSGNRVTLVFGLPGNPVSALVGFELFVRPALLALQGAADPGPHWEPATLARAQRRAAARDELVRARSRVEADGVVVDPLTGQESHMIARAASADALVWIPRGDGELAAGSAVRYLRLT